MLERIQKIISAAGVTSRRAAEELIAEGRVRVNGQVVTEPGSKADPSKDHIKVDGKLINPKQPQTYVMLNKPAGFVTTMSDPEGRPTVQDLLKGIKVRVYPVGRLDYNTEGILLLTNDGDFAHLITHPKHEFPKTYLAKVKGVLDDSQLENLEAGIYLDDGKTAPAKLKKVRKEEANSWLEITIHEGRKRQVRRMFDRVGHSVIRLKRVKTGNLVLGDLPEGGFRYLTHDEVSALKELATKEKKPEIRSAKPDVKISEASAPASRPRLAAAEARPARSRSGQRPGIGRTRVPLMQDTSDGRRKNQVVRPRADHAENKVPGPAPVIGSRGGSSYKPVTFPPRRQPAARADAGRPAAGTAMGRPEMARKPAPRSGPGARRADSRSRGPGYAAREDGRGGAGPRPVRSSYPASKRPDAGFGQREDSRYTRSARPSTGRPTARTGVGRPSSEAAMGRPEANRKPDQRPWPATRGGYSRSKSPGAGFSPRGDSSYRQTARPGGRPATGAGMGRPEADRKPATRSWSGAKRASGSKAPWQGTAGAGRRPGSGPRPNKSTHTGGGRKPGGGQRPGSRRPGQGAGSRGPRR